MFPSSEKQVRSNRLLVDDFPAAFYAGTIFRAFKEITLPSGGVLNIAMTRAVDLLLRKFSLQVNSGEVRCEIYRGATISGAYNETIPIIPCCEYSDLPGNYVTRCELVAGGGFSGGTLFDLIHIKTSGATAHAATASADTGVALGIPSGSTGLERLARVGRWARLEGSFPRSEVAPLSHFGASSFAAAGADGAGVGSAAAGAGGGTGLARRSTQVVPQSD